MRVVARAGRGLAGLLPPMSVLLGFGCASDRSAIPPGTVVRDSAGIEIIENGAAAWADGEAWRISAEPILNIGSYTGNPNYEFGYAHGPVRLADGRIVVADMQTNEMRFYDASGRYVMSTGRSGSGPGEFTQLYRLRKIDGDSLMALNPTSLTSIFTSDGEYVRRFELDFVPGQGNIWWLGRMSNGLLLAVTLRRVGTIEREPPADLEPGREYPRFQRPERPPLYRDSLLHHLFTMDGTWVDSIGNLPGQWLGPQQVAYPPNAAYTYFGDAFLHSPGNIIEIRKFRTFHDREPRVRLERIVRRAALRDPGMTEALKARYFDERRAFYRRLAESGTPVFDDAMVERQLEYIIFPDSIPAHANRMYADAEGNLWLQEYRLDEDGPYEWSIFDLDGIWLGVVETPPSFTVNEIGSDYVLGVWRDSLDVQYVRSYRLEKPGR